MSGPHGSANGAGKVVPKRIQGAEARRGGPPWMAMGMPAEKSMTFGPSARRLTMARRVPSASAPQPSPARLGFTNG